jgi:zinc/manganese transport system substrate-binding protein
MVCYIIPFVDDSRRASPWHRPSPSRINGERYEAELRGLDAWAHREVAAVPAAKRKIITSHDAFGYLGAAYGIDFHAPVGFSTEVEASASDVAELIDQFKREKIRAVLLESSNEPRLLE